MKARTLTAKHVLQLIKACKENNVTELAFGDFCLRFDPHTNGVEEPTPPATIPDEISKVRKIIADSESEQLDAEKENVAMMAIEDPFQMESMIARGELVDAETA